MALHLKRGDHVRIRCSGDEEWTLGFVALASDNYRSLAIMLNGAVRGGGGSISVLLPLMYEPDTDHYIGIVTPDEYEIELLNELNANGPSESSL